MLTLAVTFILAKCQGQWKTWTEIASVVKAGAGNDDVSLIASDE